MSGEVVVLIAIALPILLFVIIRLRPRRMVNVPSERPTEEVHEPVPQPPEQHPTEYSRLVLGDVEYPSAVIEPFESLPESRLKPLSVGKPQLAQLQTIFRHAPGLAKSAATASSNSYVMRFPPEVAEGIRNNSLKVMQSAEGGLRGVAVDAQGKIVSHATLVPASKIRMAAIAAGVFQVLAVATAQYYLPQINRRLARIEQGIHDIQEHLATQDRAILADSIKQLQFMKRLLEAGDFEGRDVLAGLIGLDAMDRDSGRVVEAYREHMERYRKEFDELPLSGVFNPDFAVASDKATRYEKAALVTLQAIYVKSVTAQFRCAVAGSRARLAQAHHGLRELESDLEAWDEHRAEFFSRFEERIREDATASLDLDELKEAFGNDDTLANQREKIVSEANERQESLIATYRELSREVKKAAVRTDRELQATSEPLTLVVDLNERNEIVQVYEQIG